MNFVQVAIPSPLRQTFTYINNSNLDLVGKRVLVEFGRRKLVGVVVSHSEEFKDGYELKNIVEVLDDTPLFTKDMVKKIILISDHYMHPIGVVFEAFIPTILRKAKHQNELIKYKQNIDEISPVKKLHTLTADQNKCLDLIQSSSNGEIVLSGITASGKTEVYKHYINGLIQAGKSALVLVPEIFLTPQIFQNFQESFGDRVFLNHSGLTPIQRVKVWLASQESTPKIIIGTRSSVFLPINNLGGIIFDEEHDQSYKQQEGFRYEAKKIAGILHKNTARIIYASATPSLSTLQKANSGKIESCYLDRRISKAPMPRISIHQVNKKGSTSGISDQLIEKIIKNEKEGYQTLILLNRRGYAPVFMCNSCGWIAKSSCCDTSLVLHQNVKRLKCHRCESVWGIPRICPECEANDFTYKGIGTQQVEEVLSEMLPTSEIIRIDRDSVSGKNRREESFAIFQDSKPKIFIGTQLLAKGHDFQNVSLVIVLNLDFGLFGADIHMQEQTAQLIIQVAGRAGRSGIENNVYLQTKVADHPLFNLIKTGDYRLIAKELLNERKKLELAPYINLVYLKAEDSNQAKLRKFLVDSKKSLSKEDIEVYGPFEGPVTKVGYKHRMFCIIQSNNKDKMLTELSSFAKSTDGQRKEISSWVIDIDPINAV
jgi:primosomal protein N' (replication factor Y)